MCARREITCIKNMFPRNWVASSAGTTEIVTVKPRKYAIIHTKGSNNIRCSTGIKLINYGNLGSHSPAVGNGRKKTPITVEVAWISQPISQY